MIRSLIIFLLVLFFLNSCEAQNALPMLSIRDSVISNELLAVLREDQQTYDSCKTFLILRTGKSKDCYEIRMGFLIITDLPYYLNEKKDCVLGYTEYNNYTVLVFNESKVFPDELFIKSRSTKQFVVKLNETTKRDSPSKKRIVPPPDIPYEPIVWVYQYCLNKREMILSEQGRFNLLY
ncbi:MAG: hypothetical protein ACK5BJ_14455 [Bacteroidota bacterium]|jgi:hypothetical protein|nr:hypothetical protein [Cytophagales bacterium]